ncbi:MAG TPA: MBL fold metallo-hydrolase [Chloroflexota bacterium]|nr:MBL fold metallo-hydrolase [Chloroflexota bacterium]
MNGIQEVVPNVFQLEMPLPFPRLPVVNVYLIRDGDELGLVDCGMNIDGAFDTFSSYLKHLGHEFKHIRQILVTHSHPDHIGLSGRIREASGGNLIMHRDEAAIVPSRYVDVDRILADLRAFLSRHGTPEDQVLDFSEVSLHWRAYVSLHRPDTEVNDGERLSFGDTRWELIWTPGHSAGHVVAYDQQRKLLFSGDHLLAKISPNVSKHPQSTLDPLHDFEASMRKVAAYDVNQTLPAHGDLFGHPAERVTELLAHHQTRRERCLEAIGAGAVSAWEISRLVFPRPEALFEKRMALFETLAHLEALRVEGRLVEEVEGGRSLWVKASKASPLPPRRERAREREPGGAVGG